MAECKVGDCFIVNVSDDNNFSKGTKVFIKDIGADDGEFTSYLVSNGCGDSYYFKETILKTFKKDTKTF